MQFPDSIHVGWAQGCAFLTYYQMMLILLVHGPHFEEQVFRSGMGNLFSAKGQLDTYNIICLM